MARALLIACAALAWAGGTDIAARAGAAPAPTAGKAPADEQASLAKAQADYAQAADKLRDLAAERDQLKARLAAMTNAAVACQAKNARLVAFSEALLEDYRKVGIGRVLGSRELFLGLERVKLENLVQDREDTIRANRCNQRLDEAPPAKPAGG
jgi:hypothetical protein